MEHTIPRIFREVTRTYPKLPAQLVKDKTGTFREVCYETLYDQAMDMACALDLLGVKRGSLVGIMSDNRAEWLVADLAILMLGGADVPRGMDAMPHEIEFILKTTGCSVCFVENETMLKTVLSLKAELPDLSHIIVMDSTFDDLCMKHVCIHKFNELLALGSASAIEVRMRIERGMDEATEDEVATVIFTSGTTGEPKGVMLTHRNYVYQLDIIPKQIRILEPGQRWLSILPIWHSFERLLQYVALSQASAIGYSKPIGKVMLSDLKAVNPHVMGSVPRIWEMLKAGIYQNIKGKSKLAQRMFHFFVAVSSAWRRATDLMTGTTRTFKKRNRVVDVIKSFVPWLVLTPLHLLGQKLVFGTIKEKMGKNLIACVSGGGSLSKPVDDFFRAVGISLLDGYGLTETAPVVGVRRYEKQVPGTLFPLAGTELRIVDAEGQEVKPGEKGVLKVRGPQIMKGYYKRPDLTANVIDEEGWLDTGDLASWTYDGEFFICGRAKDTIVLSGGENLEPVPIEARLQESEYIDQAIVVGQDQKYLGALIVLASEAVKAKMTQAGVVVQQHAKLKDIPEVRILIEEEINRTVNAKNGFKAFERVARFAILERPFTVGEELSAKQELKRHRITELYQQEIEAMYA